MKIQDIVKDSAQIEKLNLELPKFDRAQAKSSIVHIGVGRFHRAHQAVYIQDLMNAGATDWGITGVCLMPQDQFIVDKFKEQDYLYTLIEQGQKSSTVKVIGSILNIIPGYETPDAVVDTIASEQTKIVTLTVTEAGYFYFPSTLGLQWSHPAIAHDMTQPASPKTVYGFLLAALKLRRDQNLPLTIQSCDNIQGNGDLFKALTRSFVEKVEPALLEWFDKNVSFPNAMVDRITPAMSQHERDTFAGLGIEDPLGIIAEPFRQWVLEDEFVNEHPDYASVGVQMTDSVKPYEHMKVRLLNAGHSSIGYLGHLAGINTIHGIVETPIMAQFLASFLKDAGLTVPAPAGINLDEYKGVLVERFGNPTLADQTLRICKDGAAKIPGFLLPSLEELIADGETKATESFALVLAAWFVFVKNIVEADEQLDDAEAETVARLCLASEGKASLFYQDTALFGKLGMNVEFMATIDKWAEELKAKPALDVVAAFLG